MALTTRTTWEKIKEQAGPGPGAFEYRLYLLIDYTATGAIVPYFSINNIPLPFGTAYLKRLRVNQECSTAAANIFQALAEGVQVRFDQNADAFPVATGTVGGASSPGTTLGTFPTMRISVAKEMNGMTIENLMYRFQLVIPQINVQPMGNIATPIPAGPLVALGDQMRIRLEMHFDIYP